MLLQAFSVDKIGITNQASDDSFAVDFVANVTGATALADDCYRCGWRWTEFCICKF